MIERDDFKDRAIDLLEKHFPKGKSRERGEAMVMLTDLIMIDKEIKDSLYVRKTDAIETKGGDE